MASLFVARPTGYKMESADIGTWALDFGFKLRDVPGITDVQFYNVSNPRILMNRNLAVSDAKAAKSDYILFIDPDHAIDYYVRQGDPTAKPFFPEAWSFLQSHPCSIAASPYCGMPPYKPVHVFCRNKEQSKLVRLPRKVAATLRGWHAVEATGTGLMLIDMRVFDKLRHPYFDDLYRDETKTKLQHSQDVQFCLRARSMGIPVYVNFDCWCAHWQWSMVHKPGWSEDGEQQEQVPVEDAAVDASIPTLAINGPGDMSWK